jgi:hypothetical protein
MVPAADLSEPAPPRPVHNPSINTIFFNHFNSNLTLTLAEVMASTTALHRLVLAAARPTRSFHSSARALIKVGDKIPNIDVLVENSPGNKVNLAEELTNGKGLIIGIPAAFSKSFLPSLPVLFIAAKDEDLQE